LASEDAILDDAMAVFQDAFPVWIAAIVRCVVSEPGGSSLSSRTARGTDAAYQFGVSFTEGPRARAPAFAVAVVTEAVRRSVSVDGGCSPSNHAADGRPSLGGRGGIVRRPSNARRVATVV
jgi:hypothetical protein